MIWIWLGFILLILALLAFDLGVIHRKAHKVELKEALGWSAVWIALGLAFTVFIYHGYENHWLGLGLQVDLVDGRVNDGSAAALKYVTGYLIEKSLSVDNIFVFAMLFGYFAVPAIYQHRVLFWGILGALVMRGAMIAVGVQLIQAAHWILYVFGVFLIFTAIKMLLMKTDTVDPSHNFVVRLVRRWFPVTDRYHAEHFVVRDGGRWAITPLALALVMVETTDLIFAVDSIPAILAITADPFLVYTSNVFAILGLRALYFALAGMIDKFRYLKVSLALVLAVVGLKMLLARQLREVLGGNFNVYLLILVVAILAGGVIASIVASRREAARPPASQPRQH